MENKTILIEKIKAENLKRKQEYKPSAEEVQKVTELNALFIADDQARDEELRRLFNGRTLVQYLDDNQKRINGDVQPRTDADDESFRYANLLSRNKLLAILSKIATVRMMFKFADKYTGGSFKKLRIFNAWYNHFANLDNEEVKQFSCMWNAWVDGTVVSWDKPEKQTKEVSKVISADLEKGIYETVKQTIETFCHKSHIIPLQDVWFGDVWEQDVQLQPHVWLRFEMPYQTFWKMFGKLKNAKYVCPTTETQTNDVFYRSGTIGVNKVEVFFHFNPWEDRMVILSNRVSLYDGILPYGDEYYGKRIPLAVGQNELLLPNCIYGKSGADKLRGEHDIVGFLLTRLADRVNFTTNPPIFTEGNPDLPEKITMKRGQIIPVDNLNGIREFAFQNNAGEIIQAIQTFKNEADLTSVSETTQGVAQPNRTATAEAIAEAGVRQLVGLFNFFIENFLAKRAEVRAKNMLQFKDIPERIVTDENGKIVKQEYGVFTERNVTLDDGTRGDIVYNIVEGADYLPDKETLDIREAVAMREGHNVQYKYLTPDYFDGLELEIKAVPGSSTEMTPALRKRVEIEFQKGFAAFYPQLFVQNQNEFAKDYLDVYEKDIDKFLGQQATQPQMPMQGANPQMTNQLTNSQPVQAVAPQVQMASL